MTSPTLSNTLFNSIICSPKSIMLQVKCKAPRDSNKTLGSSIKRDCIKANFIMNTVFFPKHISKVCFLQQKLCNANNLHLHGDLKVGKVWFLSTFVTRYEGLCYWTVDVWAFIVLDNGQTQTPSQGYHEWFIGIDKGHVLHLTRCSIPTRKVSPRNIPTTQKRTQKTCICMSNKIHSVCFTIENLTLK
jgi:hypothetical protein